MDTPIPGGSRGPEPESNPVVVASAEPLRLRIRQVEHPSIPQEAMGIGTFLGGNLLARQAVSAETLPLYKSLLGTPRRLVFVAREKDDGSVEGQLAAMIQPSEIVGERAEEEPWKESVPSWEDEVEAATGGNADDDEQQVALLPLGIVVRIAARRSHPDDLTAEAAEVLRSVVRQGAVEIVDQFLDTI